MTYQPKIQNKAWVRKTLEINYDELFKQFRLQHEMCAEDKSRLRKTISQLEEKLREQGDACDAAKANLQIELRNLREGNADENSKLQENIDESEQGLQEQIGSCDTEKTRLRANLAKVKKDLLASQRLADQYLDDLVEIQRDPSTTHQEDVSTVRQNPSNTNQEDESNVQQDTSNTVNEETFTYQQELIVERDNLIDQVNILEAQLASMQDYIDQQGSTMGATGQAKKDLPFNDPDYHCDCCSKNTGSNANKAYSGHWHPPAVDSTSSQQDLISRLQELTQRYDDLGEKLQLCGEQRQDLETRHRDATNRANEYGGKLVIAQGQLEKARSGSCAGKCEALEDECVDLRRRLCTLDKAIETNGAAVRNAAKEALDGVDCTCLESYATRW